MIALVGVVLLGFVAVDIILSSLGAGAKGPLAPRVAQSVFAVTKLLPDRPVVHRICGPAVMVGVGGVWVVAMCASWTMILMADDSAVLQQSDQSPASLAGRAIFAGHLLSTLGGGQHQTGSELWGAVATMIGVSGMVVLTLSVSFVYSTTQAVSTGRAILALADTHGPGSGHFDTVLLPQIATLVAQVKAIPFSLYFSTVRPERRLPEALARLHGDTRLTQDQQVRLEVLLSEMPGLEGLSGNAFEAAFDDWVRRYTLTPVS
ncbi:hypothetical protein [Sagittula sp. SSi028]|uniref:hypothetical protein n=1 Tax=Sagittula sp. SSi028 TaxID=3400636 RepID=UPI003AF74C85